MTTVRVVEGLRHVLANRENALRLAVRGEHDFVTTYTLFEDPGGRENVPFHEHRRDRKGADLVRCTREYADGLLYAAAEVEAALAELREAEAALGNKSLSDPSG